MKIVKIILIAIAAIIALVLLIAAFTKKDYSLETEVVINKPKQEVFDYIKYLKNQDNFSVWAKMDPEMKKTYTGTDATVGFVSAWEGEKAGKGQQTITGIAEGEKVDYDLHFIKPMEGFAKAYLKTESVSDTETKVKWGFSSTMAWPFNFFLVLGMEKKLAGDLQQGLDNLKVELEKN